MSVDPLADDYPSWNPYNYVFDNPIQLIDPDGNGPMIPVSPQAQKIFNKYLSARNNVISRLDQSAGKGGITGSLAKAGSFLVDKLTPGSLAEQYSNSAIGMAGLGVEGPSGFKFKTTSTGKIDGRSKLVRDAKKLIKESVAGTKDLKGSTAEAEIAAQVLEKSSGTNTATGLADFAEGVLKQDKPKAVLEKIFKPVRKLIEKVQDKIDDLSVKKKD